MDFSKPAPRIIYNAEFYALAQVSRFIVPGSRRLEVKSTGFTKNRDGNDIVESTAFANPGGGFVFVAENPSSRPEKFQLILSGHFLSYVLAPKSAVTMTWR